MPEPKIVAYPPGGGQGTMRLLGSAAQGDQTISSGAKSLTGYEMDCWKRACLMAAPANGGTLTTAKTFLEEQGWTVYWDGAPEKLEARFELRLTSDEKEWVLGHGGAEMVRTLIRAAREREEREAAAGSSEA